MKFQQVHSVLLALFSTQTYIQVQANNSDRFTYANTDEGDDEYGPADWNRVSCDNPEKCEGFPDSWATAVGWDLVDTNAGCEICVVNDIKNNNCKWCPADGESCGQHRQSPIDLNRDRGLWDNPNMKDCPDWHFMRFQDGACKWKDVVDNDSSTHRNNFVIQRNALQILTPVDDDGDLQCFDDELGARYPRLDYSKGFPNWWHLAHTEVSVPSQHTQEGKRYDAEVSLSHFYEVYDFRNQLGKVVVFLEAYDEVEPWPFLDKLICQWRETEEETRKECDLDSVTTYYPGCTNYDRGHTPTPTPIPTDAPLTAAPNPSPTTGAPVTEAPATSAPFSLRAANNTIFFEKCNICGGSKTITKSDPIVDLPSFPPMTCAEFVGAGLYGMIRPSFCKLLPAFTSQCGCVEAPENPPSTDAPRFISTLAPVVANAPPNTIVPLDTFSPVTSVPETMAPGQNMAIPGTIAPGTAVPATAAPATAAPATAVPDSNAPVTRVPTPAPPPFDCPTFAGVDTGIDVNYKRICEDGGCCDSTRSSTNFCHDAYSFFNEDMSSVCYWCCEDVGPKELASPPPVNSEFEPIDCAEIDRPNRICNPTKDTSCCGERSETAYCQEIYAKYPGNMMDSICWYCCSTPQTITPEVDEGQTRKRRLGARSSSKKESPADFTIRHEALRHSNADARISHLNVQPEEKLKPPYDQVAEESLFEQNVNRFLKNENVIRNEEERRRRRLSNYDDVEYSPYEWLVKVGTEYYYRYEGTLAVPPCKDQVHWRLMKDPIQIARRQLEELERLQMERIAPLGSRFKECRGDHAGKKRKDVNGTSVEGKFDFARPVQAPHKLHRTVFCECKDWKSKFPADREWCSRIIYDRFYEHPYNFDTGGEF